MEPIYSMTTLQRSPSKVKEAARNDVVRITEQGSGGYVFASEKAFADYIARQREDAVAEARITDSIDRGISDIEAGQFVTSLDIAFARAAEAREGSDAS